MNLEQGSLSALLVASGIGLLVAHLPIINIQVISLLIAHPLFFVLLVGWYLGRPTVALVGQILHRRWRDGLDPSGELPSVSVLIPAYNESGRIENTVGNVLSQEYPAPVEVVIVDDGSTDNTWEILQRLANEHSDVRAFTKENGGIGETQNIALRHATNEIIVNIDADTLLEPNALLEMATVFRDEDTVAVGGNLGVLNDGESVWTRVQTFEYAVAMELARMFQSRLRHLLCVSGGFGGFRREALVEVGGWNDEDTISEDFELSVRLHREGRVWFTPTAVALTDVPATFRSWWRQRVRWARNGLRTMIRHWRAQFNPRFDLAGMIGLPLKAFFSLALLMKVGQYVLQLLTGELDAKTSTVYAGAATMITTSALALILLGILTSFAVNTRMLESLPWLAVYVVVYRPIHIFVKITGFLRAFGIEVVQRFTDSVESERKRRVSDVAERKPNNAPTKQKDR